MVSNMGETFYAVQQVINGRAGTLPTKVSSLEEARSFVNTLKKYSDDLGPWDGKIEYHVYEVKEIEY